MRAPMPGRDTPDHARQPAGPLAAGGALTAGLLHVEVGQIGQDLDHTGPLGDDDDRPGAQHGTGLRDGVVVHVDIHHALPRHHRHRGPARDHRLERPPILDAAGHGEQVAEGGAERDLDIAGMVDVPGDREELGAPVVGAPLLQEPLPAALQDHRHRGQRFGVVDGRGAAVETGLGGKGRLIAGLTLLALDGLQECRLLAADIGPGAMMRIEVEVDARTQDIAPDEPGGIGLGERPFEALDRLVEFAADIVVGDGRTHRIGSDGHALDQLVRVEPQDVAVLAGPGLTLVRVADQILLTRDTAGHEAPLEPGRKAGPAAPAQVRELDLLDDPRRVDPLAQDALPLRIAAQAAIGVEGMALCQRQVQGAEADGVVRGGHGAHFNPSISRSSDSGVSFS